MARNYYDVHYDSGPGFGELLGAGLGQGLEELVGHKLGQIRERQQSKRTQESYEGFGAPKSIARALSLATPEVQKQYLESGAAAQWPQLRAQEAQQFQQPRQRFQQQQQAPTSTQQFVSPSEAQSIRGRLANALNPTGDERQEELLNKLRSPQQRREALQEHGLPQPNQPQMRQQQPEYETGAMTPISAAPQQPQVPPQREERIPGQPQRPPAIDQAIAVRVQQPEGEVIPFQNPKQALAEKKQALAERSQQIAEQKLINEETEPFAKKISDDYQFAKFSEPRLKKLEKLVEKGNLPGAGLHKFIKNWEEYAKPTYTIGGLATAGAAVGGALAGAGTLGVGAPVGAALGGVAGAGAGILVSAMGPILTQMERSYYPDTEEFEKISNEFLKGAKGIFGGQFTNEEMKAYLAMIPTLMNTERGKKAVIENMHMFNKAAQIQYKAYRQVIHENGGKRPYDLEEQVNARANPQLERLSDVFRENFVEALA